MHIEISLSDFDPSNNDRLTLDLNPLYPGTITLAPYGEDNIWLARWTDEGDYFEGKSAYDALGSAIASRVDHDTLHNELMHPLQKGKPNDP